MDQLAGANKRIDLAPRLAGLARHLFSAAALIFQNSLQYDQQCRQLNRLGNELLRALFNSAHRQVNASMAGQDYHRQSGVDFFEAGQ